MQERSYKIRVEYKALNAQGNRAITYLHTSVDHQDLVLLLRLLNESPSVLQISVFSTVSIPTLETLSPLLKADLNLSELSKIK